MKATLERVRGAEVFTTLSRNGGAAGGSGGLVHHGARILVALGLAGLVTLMFPPVEGIELEGYRVGAVANEDLIAQFTFPVPKPADILERDRLQAAAAVPSTFAFVPEATDAMVAALDDLFERVGGVAQGEDAASDGARIRSLLESEEVELADDQIALLVDEASRDAIRETAVSTVRDLLPRGLVDGFSNQVNQRGQIQMRGEDGEVTTVAVADVITASQLYTEAGSRLPASVATSEAMSLVRLLLIRYLDPTYVEDIEATEQDKDAARRVVPKDQGRIVRGEAIVRANQQIGEPELQRLRTYREEQRNRGLASGTGWSATAIAGSFLRALLILLVYGMVLLQYRREIYNNFRWLLVHASLVAVFVVVASVMGNRGLTAAFLPIAFVTLSVGLLWDGRIALVMAMVMALLTSTFPTFQIHTAVPIVLAGGASAALTVRTVRRRSQTWIFIAVIAVSYGLMLLSLALLGEMAWSEFLSVLPWAALSAAVSAILAMGVLPVLEWFTGITTDQTLLEWADPNRPLLGRLSREAPGTYAHTIGVANLAEAAANAIGANGLLCRVGTYYHDVGKVVRPAYFIENQPGGRNPHARITPATSAAIIREHVTEGLKLARENGVPEVLRRFIAEHHGTQRIGFFYDKALEEADDDQTPDLADFTYPGPRPASTETAILMMADSLESATRALQDPTPERIRDLVESIVESKIKGGQLDDSPLTQREIAILKEEFIKMLAGMYHTRIDYPQTRHLTEAPAAAIARTS